MPLYAPGFKDLHVDACEANWITCHARSKETTSNTVCDNDAPCIFFEIISDEGLFMITDDAVVTFVRAGTFELPGTGYGAIGARERELVKEWTQVTLAVRRRPSWPCRMLTLSGLAERIEHGLRQRPLRVVFTYFFCM